MNFKTGRNVYNAFHANNTSEMLQYFTAKGDATYWYDAMQKELGTGYGYPFLAWACKKGNIDVVKKLISIGENVNMRDDSNFSCLMIALNDKNTELAELLINCGADVNYMREDGRSALSLAAEKKNIPAFKTILSKLENPSSEVSAFEVICKNHDLSPLYDLMAETGAKLETFVTKSGVPSLHLSIQHGNDHVFNDLIGKAGIDLTKTDKSGASALHYAIQQYPNKDYFDRLLQMKCGLQDKNVFTYISDRPSLLPLLENMAAAGSKPEKAVYGDGFTLLHNTIKAKNERMVDFLLSRNADVNAITNAKISPLHLAIQKGSLRMVESLVQNGASLTDRSNSNLSPLDMAREGKFNDIMAFLKEAEAGIPPAKKTPVVLTPANDDGVDQWLRVGKDAVSHLWQLDAPSKRITEIFNFKSHSLLTIIDDTMMKQQSVLPRESFTTINEGTLQEAFNAYEKLEGKIPRDQAIGGYPNSPNNFWTK